MWNTCDAFNYFDKENKGSIDLEALVTGFNDQNVRVKNLDAIVDLIGSDGKINYRQFQAAVTPRFVVGMVDYYSAVPHYYVSEARRESFLRSWLETLQDLFVAVIRAESTIAEKVRSQSIDGEMIFDHLDVYRMGYISGGVFSRWVKENCGYNIREDQVSSLQARFDNTNDYRINRAEFLNAVGC